MKKVKEILKNKSPEVWSVSPTTTVYEALILADEKDVGALMVLEKDKKVAGIVTERDYARKIALKGKSSKETTVKEIMTPFAEMYVVTPESTAEECLALITGKRVRHLPVIDKGHFAGLVSIGDLVASMLSEKDTLIEHLSNYISGNYM